MTEDQSTLIDVATVSDEALDEVFGNNEANLCPVDTLPNDFLHKCVEELMLRAIKAARNQMIALEDCARHSLLLTISSTSMGENIYDFSAIKYRVQCYNPVGPDTISETYNLVLSATTAARRLCEDATTQPRKLLTSF